MAKKSVSLLVGIFVFFGWPAAGDFFHFSTDGSLRIGIPNPAFAYAEEKFPFLGEMKVDKVNVRAGQSLNFERVLQLNKGNEVIVVGREYDWYKIQLPLDSECYVHGKYLSVGFDNTGLITADHVNLRSGAGENFSPIGQANKETRVKIKGQAGAWYKIEPTPECFGWVYQPFVTFKSNQIPPQIPSLLPVAVETIENTHPGLEGRLSEGSEKASAQGEQGHAADLPTVSIVAAPEPEKMPPLQAPSFSIIGQLDDLGRVVRSKAVRHKLTTPDKRVYYLEGDKSLFRGLAHYRVQVEGDLKTDSSQKYPYPVVSVSKVTLQPNE